jgi:hypothetical protein
MTKKRMAALVMVLTSFLMACSPSKKEDNFEEYLEGTITAESFDGEKVAISDLLKNDSCFYIYEDVDGDGTDELCLKANSDTYLVKDFGSNLKVIYEGADYDMPVNTEKYTGMYYCYLGQAPLNERYKFTKFDKNGNVTSSEYASWYDANENNTMDEDDWFFLDPEEDNEVDMNKWLESAEGYLEMKNTRVDWQEMKLIK